jgi:hypothetical protein
MRRRISIALGLALATTFAVVGLSAPANASGYVLYKSFGWPDACSSAGYAGQQSGQWKFYYCDEIAAPSWDAPGLVDLYVAY